MLGRILDWCRQRVRWALHKSVLYVELRVSWDESLMAVAFPDSVHARWQCIGRLLPDLDGNVRAPDFIRVPYRLAPVR